MLFLGWVLLSERSAAGVVRVYQEPIGPEFVQWMRVLGSTGVPYLLVHSCGAAGHRNEFALGEDPVSELEVGSLRGACDYYGYSEAKRFCVDGLQ